MLLESLRYRASLPCAVLGTFLSLTGCGSKDAPAPAPAPTASTDTAAAPGTADIAPVTAAEVTKTWTPEALEELLAPIALYPDPVLSQMLIASTNPQEVLDAGNWLLQNQGLKGKPLDDAAAEVGFTPPVRALVQFPETVDMMCLELGWTTELGEAFVADQAGVLDAVQRLRKQAIDVGNLQSSSQMDVVTEQQEGHEVVVLKPAEPEVVYVPQYDPVAAYAPPPAAPAATTAAPATTTVVVDDDDDDDEHSTGTLITTGLLAFGAGILVNEVFDDDDDYYYPHYGYGGMPYYPPYPYRPAYGGGYYPSNGYHRPPNYNSGFQNSGNIIINTGGNRTNAGYWDRYGDQPGRNQRAGTASSPITAARSSRPELSELNKRQPRSMPADVKRPSPDATAKNWKGQSGYAGAKSRDQMSTQERISSAQPGYSKPSSKAATRDTGRQAPKVQGSYAGAGKAHSQAGGANRAAPATRDLPQAKSQTRDASRPASTSREAPRPSQGTVDRGYTQSPAARPQQQRQEHSSRPAHTGGGRGTAVSGGSSAQAQRAASHRGKQSLPQGARSKGGGRSNSAERRRG
jgi:hypothetical protein